MCYIDHLYNLLRIHLIYFFFEAYLLVKGINCHVKGIKYVHIKNNPTHLLPFHALPQLNNTFVKLKILLKRIYRTKRLDSIMLFFRCDECSDLKCWSLINLNQIR